MKAQLIHHLLILNCLPTPGILFCSRFQIINVLKILLTYLATQPANRIRSYRTSKINSSILDIIYLDTILDVIYTTMHFIDVNKIFKKMIFRKKHALSSTVIVQAGVYFEYI